MSSVQIETLPFREGKVNTRFKCGMFSRPYMSKNQCGNLACCIVTDTGLDIYNAYRIRWNKVHPMQLLPILCVGLICQKHLAQVERLPDNPRDRKVVTW